MTGPGKTIEQQIRLPFKEAVRMSVKSLVIRFGRSVITTAGIFLGIAFLMSIFTSDAIIKALLTYGSLETRVSLQAVEETMKAKQLWLVGLSLMVCGVGIANAMLMAVTERYKEIGTMKCLGALNRFVVELFLLESGFQGIFGSVGGVIVGSLAMIIAAAVRYGSQVFTNLPLLNIGIYACISIAIGTILSIVGAIYPAYVAAKMVPADAMRREI